MKKLPKNLLIKILVVVGILLLIIQVKNFIRDRAATYVTKKAYAELIETGNLDILDKYYAQNLIDHNPLPGQKPALEGYKETFKWFATGFPDLVFTHDDIIPAGDKVTVRGTLRGTHRGTFLGIKPTGKKVEFSGIAILKLQGGKVTERWYYFDGLGLLTQLGILQ